MALMMVMIVVVVTVVSILIGRQSSEHLSSARQGPQRYLYIPPSFLYFIRYYRTLDNSRRRFSSEPLRQDLSTSSDRVAQGRLCVLCER
jgi:hypothetical protein